jgi:predicted acylesterase/phospholipase RssA
MTTLNDMLKLNNLNNVIDDKIKSIITNYKSNKSNIIKNLVLSGGGSKGIAHIGALKALEEKGFLKNIKNIAASSVGGLIACLYVIGYSPDELYNFFELFDLSKCRAVNPSDFLKKFGVDDGSKILLILEKMFIAKNVSPKITFNELLKKYGINLILTTVCLNDKNVHYLSNESVPDMAVIFALRMTSSFPFWFIPVEYKNKLYVDGGCIDNYPVNLFSNELDNTIGIFLVSQNEYVKNINNIEDYFMALLECLLESHVHSSIQRFEKYTIKIDIQFVGMVQLNLSNIVKKQIFTTGYNNTIKYFNNIKNI